MITMINTISHAWNWLYAVSGYIVSSGIAVLKAINLGAGVMLQVIDFLHVTVVNS